MIAVQPCWLCSAFSDKERKCGVCDVLVSMEKYYKEGISYSGRFKSPLGQNNYLCVFQVSHLKKDWVSSVGIIILFY